jgi:hypothetical protein
MAKFRYTVINPENKKLTGTIVAPDEKGAREELNQLGFSIITIEILEEVENEAEEQVPTFEFAAIDKSLKRIVGTIKASDRYSGYKRLVKEYSFEVEYLIDLSLDEAEKTAQRQKGVYDLQNKLDEEEIKLKQKNNEEEFDLESFHVEQKALQTQVEFVLKKVKEMLDLYENDIRPETKEKIRRAIDKILRIKNSTNFDYIRKSCEDLLKFIQQEEIFLYEDKKKKEHAKLTLEAKNMMAGLHRKDDGINKDIFAQLKTWRYTHITTKEQPSGLEILFNFLISFLIGFSRENEEIRDLNQQIRTLRQQIFQYIKLYLQANTSELKVEAREGLQKLLRERKKLKNQLKNAKKNQKLALKNKNQTSSLENFSQEVLIFSGWLLAFYLIYYFSAYYITTKNFSPIQLPSLTPIYSSSFLKYLLTGLFLFHSILSLKIHFFRRNGLATLVMTPCFIFVMILIFLNF